MSDQTTQPDPYLGRVLAGKLRLDALLGAGAGGAVYRAHHMGLDKPVAIKVLHASHVADPQLVGRFKAEARAASRLDHPNSVRILDFGEDGEDHLLYIAMEYLDGEDLQELLAREGPLPAWRIGNIMAQVSAALLSAHEQGIVHRDMKPGNIMLLQEQLHDGTVRDFVKVCDFGLAKILDVHPDEMTNGPLTQAGTIFGTPAYMAPEQANGEVIDARADQYACAIIIYRMATGEPAFSAENATGILMKQILEAPPKLEEQLPGADPRLCAIVERGLKKDRDERYPSMREVLTILQEVAAEAPAGAVVAPRMPSTTLGRGATTAPMTAAPMAATHVPSSAVDTPKTKKPWLGAVLGSTALVVVSGLAVYVLQKPNGASSEPVEPPVGVAPPVAPPVEPPPVEPPVVAVIEPPPPAKVEPKTPPPKKAAKKPRRKKPKTTPKKPAPPPPDLKPKVPQIQVTKGPRTIVVPDLGELQPVKPKIKITPKPAPPAGPARLTKGFNFSVSLSGLEVSGGLSTRKTRTAINKSMAKVKACLRSAVERKGVETSGSLSITSRLSNRGQFRSIVSRGALPASCVQDGLRNARGPRPDTGDADVRFKISYKASN